MSDKNRVLVVDDMEMNRYMLRKVFKEQFTVLQTEDGKQAMQLFRVNEISPAQLDLSLSVIDGYTATRKIWESEHQQAKSIPIIAMTFNAFTEDVTTSLAAGMNDHVSKPISYYRLLRVLSKFVGGDEK